MDLISALTSQLNVTTDQAKGGAGALLKLAKEHLSAEEFGKVADAVPEAETLVDDAPEESGSDSSLGGLGSLGAGLGGSLGGGLSQIAGLASLGGVFSKLGLDSSMISRFVPVIMKHVQSMGGDTVQGLLAKVLK